MSNQNKPTTNIQKVAYKMLIVDASKTSIHVEVLRAAPLNRIGENTGLDKKTQIVKLNKPNWFFICI